MIALNNIRLRHPDSSRSLLDGIDLQIEPGQRLLIEGPSGCGKSTLAHLIAGLTSRPVEGSILLDGQAVSPAGDDLRRATSLVFQNSSQTLIMPDVEQELVFGLENRNVPPGEIERRLTDLSHRFNLSHLLPKDPLPLSLGEKQKVALAAALMSNPRLLILDEPEAHLDPSASRALLDLLAPRLGDAPLSVLIFDHPNSGYRSWADTVLHLDNGRLLAAPSNSVPPKALSVPKTAKPTPAKIFFQAGPLTFRPYPGEPLYFEDIDIALASGEIVLLRGNNGSGKSTLLRTLLKPPAPLRDAIHPTGPMAYLPQEARDLFLHHTVGEEFAFLSRLHPSHTADQSRLVLQRLEIENLHERELRTLSAGEEQVVALGLVLASPASVFFLDEPTSHLDHQQKERVIRLITTLGAQGAAFLITSQDAEINGLFDRFLRLEQGRLETSTP